MGPPQDGEDTEDWTLVRLAEYRARCVDAVTRCGYDVDPARVTAVIAGPFTPAKGGRARSFLRVAVTYWEHTPARVEALGVMFRAGQADGPEGQPVWPAGADAGLVAAHAAGRACRVGPSPFRAGTVPQLDT